MLFRSQVDHTDFEGRLILADAMCYAQQSCKPRALLDMATLTCRYNGLGKLLSRIEALTVGDSAGLWDAGQGNGEG